MAFLDPSKIKKLRRGELCGVAATVFCGIVLVYFITCFIITAYNDMPVLKTVMWCTAPPLSLLGIAAAAFCNFKYSAPLEGEINRYIAGALAENAKLLHPEKSSLTFAIEVLGGEANVYVNGDKEHISLDLSALAPMGAAKRAAVADGICEKLSHTFIKLYLKGIKFKSVDCRIMRKGGKTGKPIPVIDGDGPDKKALKKYFKSR